MKREREKKEENEERGIERNERQALRAMAFSFFKITRCEFSVAIVEGGISKNISIRF